MYEAAPVPLAYPIAFMFLAFAGLGFTVGAAGTGFGAYSVVRGREVPKAAAILFVLHALATIAVIAVASMEVKTIDSGFLAVYARGSISCAYVSVLVIMIGLMSYVLSRNKRP